MRRLRQAGTAARACSALVGVALGLCPRFCRADTFQLAGGGMLTGQLLATDGGVYTIRTTVGTVRLPVAGVTHITAGDTPFAEYDQRAQAAAATPASQTELAEWCAAQGLRTEERKHLERALEFDTDYAPARHALGQVRVGGLWVDGRRGDERAARAAKAPEPANDPERAMRARRGQWTQRIAALRSAMLESGLPGAAALGRAKLLEIRDPLAVLPLVEVLGAGPPATRAVLIDALRRFAEDEATLNLAVLALTEPVDELRQEVLAELYRRNDARVIAQYRQALHVSSDVVSRRAAVGLGALEATAAVPDLIAALVADRHRWVEVPLRAHLSSYPQIFNHVGIVQLGPGTAVSLPPQLGGYRGDAGSAAPEARNTWRFRRVRVLRTEVLEALRRITGQDFGFDQQRWRSWYEEHRT
jgi:hypothetical protein